MQMQLAGDLIYVQEEVHVIASFQIAGPKTIQRPIIGSLAFLSRGKSDFSNARIFTVEA
jgi:hypothetical protein